MSFTSSARMLEASCASSRGPITGAVTAGFASSQASAASFGARPRRLQKSRQAPNWFRSTIGPTDLADLPLFVSQQPLISSRLMGWLGFPADELRVVGTYNLLNNMRYIVASGRECFCLSGIVEEDEEVMFLPLEPAMTTYSLFVWPTSTVKDALGDAFRECVRREIEAETKGGVAD